jgi:peptidoglycan/xylan/chitin deacetylase (PgdA/CDA1 family)
MTQPESFTRQESFPGKVPILTYHSLDKTGSVISLAPEVFRRQMQALHAWGYQGIRVSDLLDAWEGKQALAPRPVVLTFDDGFRNFLDHAAPVLQDLGFRATVFAVAGHCGGSNDWPTDPPGIPRLPLLSWSALRHLVEAGFEVGAHTMTHPPLPALGRQEAAWEITTARAVLEDRLGCPVTVFAYPYGLVSKATRELVRGHYRGACGAGLGIARAADDRHQLRRVEMYYYRPAGLFQYFPTPLGRAYLGLRAIGRGCRALLSGWPRSGRKAPRSSAAGAPAPACSRSRPEE